MLLESNSAAFRRAEKKANLMNEAGWQKNTPKILAKDTEIHWFKTLANWNLDDPLKPPKLS